LHPWFISWGNAAPRAAMDASCSMGARGEILRIA
jgi:hypothetical protein